MASFKLTRKELKDKNPFEFNSGDRIYVRPNEQSDFKYIIELKKEKYPTFSLETRVCCAKTYEYLNCMVGNKKGMTPAYIDNFKNKKKTREISNMIINYETKLEEEHLSEISTSLIQELEKFLGYNINYIHFDVSSIIGYDLHIEYKDNKDEFNDIYLSITDDKQNLVNSYNAGEFDNIVSKQTVDKLIEAILKMQLVK